MLLDPLGPALVLSGPPDNAGDIDQILLHQIILLKCLRHVLSGPNEWLQNNDDWSTP